MERITKLAENQVFVDIPNYEGIYAITRYGEVWSYPKVNGRNSHQKGKWLKQQTERTGYKFVVLQKNKDRKTCYVHNLVYKSYISDYSKELQINHIDGKKGNNTIYNLEVVTPSQNIRHSFKLGLSNQKGSHNAHSKLGEKDICDIRKLALTGVIQEEIATMFGVSPATICRIINYKSWNYVS